MRRIRDSSTFFIGFDLLSEIGTYPIELGNHCLDLVRSQTVLSDFKFNIAAQMLAALQRQRLSRPSSAA